VVVTVIEPVMAVNAALSVVGETVTEHADSVTVNVCPPIVSVPDREVIVLLAAALNPTVPPPVPLAPDVTDSHPALLAAVHGHAVPVASVTVPLPPDVERD
jgi:hypothetical protein